MRFELCFKLKCSTCRKQACSRSNTSKAGEHLGKHQEEYATLTDYEHELNTTTAMTQQCRLVACIISDEEEEERVATTDWAAGGGRGLVVVVGC